MNAIKEKRRTAPKYAFTLRVDDLLYPNPERDRFPTLTFNQMQKAARAFFDRIRGYERAFHCDGHYFDYEMGRLILYRNVEMIDGSNSKLLSRIIQQPVASVWTEKIDIDGH